MVDMIFHLASELPLKGRERGRGWVYGGNDSRDFTNEMTRRVISYFTANDYPNLATAANTFLRTCGREGYISAINTWDGQILTWGVGFAHGKINRALWPMLSGDVKNELARLVPSRFSNSGIVVDQAIRRDRDALAALIYVSETDPFRESVFRSMFKGFVVGTLGIDIERLSTSRNYIIDNPSLVYFASRLAHWLPAGYRMQRDLPRTESLSLMTGANRSVDATQFVAASIRVFAENFLRSDRFGETREGNRRVLKEDIGDRFNMIVKWQNRMRQYTTQDVHFTISSIVTRLVPSFTRPVMPFFDIHDDWRSIPAGHLVLSEGRNDENWYIDVGPQ